ncbi:unnamed protein product [Meloidogyne enterolobii]|uniref:Uncharacterized protein n=2 Tax=Meloidogyne enterolobii TaxID=390850 RepID=A0A6V7WQP0_MELEN|nr:unnamed protein product [Meloidogyne enterolobii]
MEQLRNFKPFDLHEKLRLSDNDFDAWLGELGLLHGKGTCHKCGGRTTLSVNKDERYDVGGVQPKIVEKNKEKMGEEKREIKYKK